MESNGRLESRLGPSTDAKYHPSSSDSAKNAASSSAGWHSLRPSSAPEHLLNKEIVHWKAQNGSIRSTPRLYTLSTMQKFLNQKWQTDKGTRVKWHPLKSVLRLVSSHFHFAPLRHFGVTRSLVFHSTFTLQMSFQSIFNTILVFIGRVEIRLEEAANIRRE